MFALRGVEQSIQKGGMPHGADDGRQIVRKSEADDSSRKAASSGFDCLIWKPCTKKDQPSGPPQHQICGKKNIKEPRRRSWKQRDFAWEGLASYPKSIEQKHVLLEIVHLIAIRIS